MKKTLSTNPRVPRPENKPKTQTPHNSNKSSRPSTRITAQQSPKNKKLITNRPRAAHEPIAYYLFGELL